MYPLSRGTQSRQGEVGDTHLGIENTFTPPSHHLLETKTIYYCCACKRCGFMRGFVGAHEYQKHLPQAKLAM